MAPTRTTPGTAPDFLTSPDVGELVALALAEHADRTEREAAESGTPRIAAALVRLYRRAATQITDAHTDGA